jgi:uncharacterized membrane protein YeaQ/YmgE (transglycosylase-associated protein family)
MTAVFDSFLNDFVIAFILGVLGGVAAELIANNGNIEFPHLPADKINLFDMGIASNILLGGIAALAYLFVLETTDPYKFVGAMIGAGVGGSAILTAIKEKLNSTITQGNADTQNALVESAANNIEGVRQELEDLQAQLNTTKVQDLEGFKKKLAKLNSTTVFAETSLKDSLEKSKKNLKRLEKTK